LNHSRLIVALALGCATLIAATTAAPALQESTGMSGATASGDYSPRSPLDGVLGSSGKLRALIGTPASLAQRLDLHPILSGVSIDEPGVHPLALPAPDGDPLVVVSLESFGATRGSMQDGYRVGRWPTHGVASNNSRYAPPAEFIAVTPENELTPVSKRFRLRDFLTHDQQDVWPKVLVLRTPLLDKLELIGDELERRGLPGVLHVMSGFRTPQYNAQGAGAKGGRAGASRHMYGDAADVFVDADGDGKMDDLDGDGRITVRDARVLYAAAETVEARYPDLVGGLSAYTATTAHGPFVHVDTRGVRARW